MVRLRQQRMNTGDIYTAVGHSFQCHHCAVGYDGEEVLA